MNPFKIASDLLGQSSLLTLYVATLIATYSVAAFFFSKVIASPQGRTEVWFALEAGSYKDRLAKFGSSVLGSRFFHVLHFRGASRKYRFYVPIRGALDIALLFVITLTAVVPWILSLSGTESSLGPSNFFRLSPRSQEWAPILCILVALIALAKLEFLGNYSRLAVFLSLFIAAYLLFFQGHQPIPYDVTLSGIVPFFSVLVLVMILVAPTSISAIIGVMVYLVLVTWIVDQTHFVPSATSKDASLAAAAFALSTVIAFGSRGKKILPDYRRIVFLAGGFLSLCLVSLGLRVLIDVENNVSFSEFVFNALSYAFLITTSLIIGHLVTPSDSRVSAIWVALMLFLSALVALLALYGIQITSWAEVSLVTIYICLGATLTTSVAISMILTANLSAIGFRSARPFFWGLMDFLLSGLVLFGCLGLFLAVMSVAAPRPGSRYIGASDILDRLAQGDPSHSWLTFLVLIPGIFSLFHLSIAMFSTLALLPNWLRRFLVRLLETPTDSALGYEKPLVTILVSTWITFFPVSAIFLVALIVRAALTDLPYLSEIAGGLFGGG